MSRIGKMPISVPGTVKVSIEGGVVKAEGPKGKLEFGLTDIVSAKLEDGKILVDRNGDNAKAKAFHGMTRAIINNMVTGVSEGFKKNLEINGVGFKAEMDGANRVKMSLGYSHPCLYELPDQVNVTITEGGVRVAVEGPDKQAVGKVASELRAFYPAEPYKGKGVKYSDEVIIRKEGKKV